MKKFLCSLIVILKIVSSCTAQQKAGVSIFTANWNDHINTSIRNQIKKLDDQVILAFNKGDAQLLTSLYSERLKGVAVGQTESFVNLIHPSITSQSYTILDEYLVMSDAVGSTQHVFKGMSQDNDYNLDINPFSKETYVSLIIYSQEHKQLLFTAIYGKYGDNWKLDIILAGPYTIWGKNAVDFYKQAKREFENGDLIDANLSLRLAQQTALPASNIFVYFKFEEMKEFGKKLDAEGQSKLPFPIAITELKTAPQIFNAEPVIINEGIFPLLKYKTTIPLTDTVALRAENEQLKKAIIKLFPEVHRNNKYVFLKAYNEIPNGKTPVPTYGFVLKAEER